MVCKRPYCDNEIQPRANGGNKKIYCCRSCSVIDSIDRLRTKRKQEAIDYLGGKCKECGYSKCPAALHFHHTRDKSFTINRGITMSWDRIKDELDKCILLCANCHAEHHWDRDQ